MVSRQAVIDVLKERQEFYAERNESRQMFAIANAIDDVLNLPSVSDWRIGIPTDREGIFLIQTKRNNLFLVRWADGFWEETTGDDCLEDDDVVAWQKITPLEGMQKRFDTSQKQSSVQ